MVMECKVTARKSHYPKDVPFEVPEGWVWCCLSDVGKWQSGSTPSRGVSEYYGGTIPWLKTGDLNDGYINSIPEFITEKALEETSVKMNPVGSVLIAMYGATIGKVGILTFPATTNQACCACSEFNGVYNKYLFYFLISHKDAFIRKAGGGAQPNISKEIIVNTPIPIPPAREQERIVNAIESWLCVIDGVVVAQQDLLSRVEDCKSKVLDLAIHGKLVPQDSTDEPAIELLKRINPDFNASDNLHYVDCPSGWVATQMKSIINLLSGRDLDNSRCNAEGYGVPYLVGASCIDNGHINIYRWTETPEVISKKGDVLLSCKGTVGEVVLNTLGNLHIARQFMAIRSKAPQYILPEYLGIIIKASIDTLKKAARGIIPGISRENILELTVLIPPFEEQQRILSRIAELNHSVSQIGVYTCN